MAVSQTESTNHFDLSDGQLLRRFAQRREQAAFELLVRRHGPLVMQVCQRVVGDRHLAEDAFQATFVVLAHKAHSIRSPELLGNWLYGVAYRTALKAKARLNARRRQETHADMNQMPMKQSDQPIEVDDELLGALDEEINRLPERFRAAIVLCDLQGRNRKEAAASLSVSEGTLSSRLSRSRQKLRARLMRRGLAVSAVSLTAALCSSASAALPDVLVASTTATVISLSAAGTLAAGGTVSASVLSLSEGVMRMMFLAKLKAAAAILLALGVATTVSVVTHQVILAQSNKIPVAAANLKAAAESASNNDVAVQTGSNSNPTLTNQDADAKGSRSHLFSLAS